MPDQSYYPAWKIRLTIRLEEYADTTAATLPSTGKKLITQLKGKKPDRTDVLKVELDPTAPEGVVRWILAPKEGTDDKPQDVKSSKDNLTFSVGTMIPSKMTWSADGALTADQLKVEMPFKFAPFDPRVIRSAAIEAYIGTLTEDEFVQGVSGKVRQSYSGSPTDGEPLNVVPDTFLDARGTQRSNLRFQGWVDVWEVEWSDDSEPMVSLQCRDNTTLLIDQDAATQLAVDEKKLIDESIATYLSNYPQFAGMSVEYRPTSEDPPRMGEALAKTAYKPKIGPGPTKQGGGSATGNAPKMSVWDYLTDVAGTLGLSVKVEGTTIVVQRVRWLTSHGGEQRPTDPFVPRDYDGYHMDRRTLIYGRNIQSMRCNRKYSKSTPQNIEVRCYSTLRKKMLVVRFPEKINMVKNPVLPGDDRGENRVHVIKWTGVDDLKTLRVIAQSCYESIGRRELGFHVTTRALASWGGGNEDPDLLDLQAGDAVDILVHRDDVEEYSTMNNLEAMMLAQQSAARFLRSLGYDPAFAQAYQESYAAVGFQTTFIVRGFKVDCDIQNGVAIDLDCCNYVGVRADQILPNGEEQSGAPAQAR